jgi:hypothetical protein
MRFGGPIPVFMGGLSPPQAARGNAIAIANTMLANAFAM